MKSGYHHLRKHPHGSYGKKHLILVGVFPPIWKNMQPSNFWTIFPKFQGWKIERNLKPPPRKHTGWTNMAGWKITILNRRFTSSPSWLEFSSQSCYMLVVFCLGGVTIRPWETNAFHKQQKDGLIAPVRCRISPTHHVATSWKQPFWKNMTLPKTNRHSAWKWAETQKDRLVLEPSIFKCDLLVSGRVL